MDTTARARDGDGLPIYEDGAAEIERQAEEGQRELQRIADEAEEALRGTL